MSVYHINVKDSEIFDGSAVVLNQYVSSEHEEKNAIIEELQKISASLAQTEPMLANAICELQQALEQKNQPKISSLLAQLSTGFAANVLSNLASGALRGFLGLG